MKKLLSFMTALLLCTFAFAELASSQRYFEYGLDVEAGASNNYFRAPDILVKDVVIDITEMAKKMPGDGFVLDYETSLESFFALNLNQFFRSKFYFGISGNGYGNISKSFFEMLGEGFEAKTSKKITTSLYADMFAYTGASVKTEIKGYGIRVSPEIFVPIVHVADTDGYVKYTASETGKIRAEGDIPVNIYSVISLENIKSQSFDSGWIQDALTEAIESVGFDISGEVEHKVTKTFDMGIFTRIPIVPGRLKHKASTRYWGYFEQNNLLGYLDDTEKSEKDYGHDDMTYSSTNCIVHRPFILGTEGAWRPFGNWCVFRPKLDMVVRNPFSSDLQFFGEYAFLADFLFLKVFGITFGTSYENLVFKQTAGFMVNTRAVEFKSAVIFRGADFAASFGLSGMSAYAGLRIGF